MADSQGPFDFVIERYDNPLIFFYSDQQNVVAVQYQGKIFYRVCREIKDDKELLTYYGDSYFEEMGGNPHKFHSNIPSQVEDELVSYLIN